MRYIIYGAGGIGSIMGGHLFRTGHDVILIGRKGHVDIINSRGLKLVTPAGTYELKIPAVTSPGRNNVQKGRRCVSLHEKPGHGGGAPGP